MVQIVRWSRAWLCVAALSGALIPSEAKANIAAPQQYPSVVVKPSLSGGTPLIIDREKLQVTCSETGDGEPACRFEAVYWVRNPTPQLLRVTPGFLSQRTEQVEIWVDGQRVDRPLAGEEAERLIPAVREGVVHDGRFAQPPGQTPGSTEEMNREQAMAIDAMSSAVAAGPVPGFDLEVAPGAVREVKAIGRLVPGEYWEPGHYIAYPARDSRHPLLSPDRRSGVYEVDYFVSPIRTWGGSGPIEVVIQVPTSWQTRVDTSANQQRTVGAGGATEIRFVTSAEQLPSLHIVFELPRRRFHPGGPVAGIGGTFGDAGGFRMRFGWELSEPDWLLYSATADTDFDDVLVLTPMVEAATPWILVIPSLGAGLGVPVRVEPDTQVGVRLQGTVAFGPAAWVTSYDIFPGVDKGRPDRKQLTMLFQLTL